MFVQLSIFRDGAWVEAGDVRSYDAATLEGLCAVIGATLVEDGFIRSPTGVYVDSYYGVLSHDWHPVWSFGQISTDQMSLRIGQHVESAELIVGTKRKFDAAQRCGAAAAPRPQRQVGRPNRFEDSAELPLRNKPARRREAHCKHGKKHRLCRDCGGSSLCLHNRPRCQCRICRGTGICERNRVRSACRDCGGNSRCEHGKLKWCRECHRSAFCKHDRRKPLCRECGGSALCIHDRQKHRCKECNGPSISGHNCERGRCAICKADNHDACNVVMEKNDVAIGSG